MSVPPEKSESPRIEPSSNAEPIQQPVGVALATTATKANTNVEKHGIFHNVDGGGRGWASVMGAWLIQFSMLGAVLSFGSYQTFYQNQWLPLFMEFFLGVFGGFLLDGGHWRWTVGGGCGLFVFTFFMLSLCPPGQYAPIILAQGIGMGGGLGFAFLPVTGLVAKHFKKRRALALGVISTGTSIGGFVFSLLGSKLFYTNVGFPWTVRISAFIVLAATILANLLLSDPKVNTAAAEEPEPDRAEAKVDVPHEPEEGAVGAIGNTEKTETAATAPSKRNDTESTSLDPEGLGDGVKPHQPRTMRQMLRDPAYLAIISMGFVVSLGLYFPPFAIQSFALDHGIPSGLADWLLPLLNLTSVLGRTIPNWLADRYGLFELYIPCTLLAGVIQFALGGATNSGGVVVLAILYGFFSGSVPALYFPMISSLDPDVASTGMRMGVACMPVGIASLIGNPIAEALVGPQRTWWHGLGFAGASQVVSAMLLTFAWVMEKKRHRV
ncbi:mannose-1-phosphate guanyltransferase [Pestalotiopsis sp. IQ-011]